ncbi:hypothetical protein ETB97_000017 [Aspergillus alliaceus]|uniref:Uncharacterized protein n=1 Tax=Petromyces alliaceus TaxID=209559 RepID=A0A5N7C4X1_PETAA|nr:uncharacterized protein BDW43DRAFT_287003 [Aspergillus alliaceus]KAB8229978.1 hypothetical protein BDW43DRAFT_287003 [Aspergillus alliaceus]KAE8388747.1 hypothetical protein BDV23DRAFT_158350 [Aspergillus alliaceus]KAF5867248.1 hypothetical protein ETB97_000017 [Aspergillus burnettii]
MKAFTILGAAAALCVAPAIAQEDLGRVSILPFPFPSGTPTATPSGTPSTTPLVTPWPTGGSRPTGIVPIPTISWPTPSSSGVPPPYSSPVFAFHRRHPRQVRPIFD